MLLGRAHASSSVAFKPLVEASITMIGWAVESFIENRNLKMFERWLKH